MYRTSLSRRCKRGWNQSCCRQRQTLRDRADRREIDRGLSTQRESGRAKDRYFPKRRSRRDLRATRASQKRLTRSLRHQINASRPNASWIKVHQSGLPFLSIHVRYPGPMPQIPRACIIRVEPYVQRWATLTTEMITALKPRGKYITPVY